MKQCYQKKNLPFLLLYIMSATAIAQPYVWKNVKICACGYVTEPVLNPAQSNLLYARTGADGACRWHATFNNLGTAYRFHGAG